KAHNPSWIPALNLNLKTSSSKSNFTPTTNTHQNPPSSLTLKSLANIAIFIGATASIVGSCYLLPAKAQSPPTLNQQTPVLDEQNQEQDLVEEFAESNIEALKSVMQEKLENGQDEEALKLAKRLVAAQPKVTEWRFLMGRLLNEMGQTEYARQVFEEILAIKPLCFEALFENALLMDRCGEGEAVIRRLEEALAVAEEEKKVKEARDVRLIMAQIHFLQKNVEEALRSYEQLAKEDPTDFRPYFCQGMIYSLVDRNDEAKDMFAKYRLLSPKKFDVEGYVRTPLSRMKIFGKEDKN
ncbi:TPR_2 domain-containing protein/TPR_9 domain-containing protein, partial [Cephalotus follicularis]